MARYHSLVTDPEGVPEELDVVAWTAPGDEDDADRQAAPSPPREVEEVQGIRHRAHPVWGVQFHPESLFSQGGKALLERFLTLG